MEWNWYVESGTWKLVVQPADLVPPMEGATGAGTVLAGNYAVLVDSRLVSPFSQFPLLIRIPV